MSAPPPVVPGPALEADLEALDARRGVADVGGLRLHYLDYGGGQPEIVVLAGITSPAITWDFVVRELRDLGRIVVPDLRGRGLSDAPASGYGLREHADDLLGLLDVLGVERPVLLGHSQGARVAAAFAVAHPGRAGALILLDPPLSGPGRPYPMSREVFHVQLEAARAGATADDVRAHFPRWPERELELRTRWLPTVAEAAIDGTHASFESETFEPLWRELRPPVALLYGEASPVVTAPDVAVLAALNPAAVLLAVAGAGHMLPWDELDATLALLRALIRPLRDAATSVMPEGGANR